MNRKSLNWFSSCMTSMRSAVMFGGVVIRFRRLVWWYRCRTKSLTPLATISRAKYSTTMTKRSLYGDFRRRVGDMLSIAVVTLIRSYTSGLVLSASKCKVVFSVKTAIHSFTKIKDYCRVQWYPSNYLDTDKRASLRLPTIQYYRDLLQGVFAQEMHVSNVYKDFYDFYNIRRDRKWRED